SKPLWRSRPSICSWSTPSRLSGHSSGHRCSAIATSLPACCSFRLLVSSTIRRWRCSRPGLSGGHRRHGHGTARHGYHGLDADCRAADRPHGYAPPARNRAWAHRLVVQRDDRMDADVSQSPIISVGVVQGAGLGFLFVPLSAATLSTLPLQTRTEGAGLYNLSRNIGSSVGISIVNSLITRNTQANHAAIVPNVTAV